MLWKNVIAPISGKRHSSCAGSCLHPEYFISVNISPRGQESADSLWKMQWPAYHFLTKNSAKAKAKRGGFKEVFEKTFGERKLFIVAEVKSIECWLITGYWQP